VSKFFRRAVVIILLLILVAGVFIYLRPVTVARTWQTLRLRLSGTEVHQIVVKGIQMRYEALGPADGKALVLVHGLGGNAEDWRNLAPYFVKSGYRVYMPDLPGYGGSEKPANFSYSISDESAIVVGFLDALGLKQVDLGGWSMGGWIVQTVAYEHPERVNKLILFDSAGLKMKPDWNTALFTPQTPEEIDQLDALLTPKPPKVPGFVAADIIRFSEQRAWVIKRAIAAMLSANDVTDEKLPTLKMKTLIVWDSDDRITPLTEGEEIHQLISGSEFFVIKGCGHMAPVNCSIEIGPKVAEFLTAEK
jgi:pimeloyl-ACP methyl ester carboxylesterase